MNEYDVSLERLLSQACNGDEEALVILLERTAPSVRRSIRGKISVRWQSALSEDDVMQQTFADAFLSIKRFEGNTEDFGRWLRTLAANNLRDAVRHLSVAKRGGEHRQVLASPHDSVLNLWDNLADSISTPSVRARRNEANELLNQAVDKLPEAYRRVVIEYDLDQHTAQEVADANCCSVGAMYMRRARAHYLLAELIGVQSLMI